MSSSKPTIYVLDIYHADAIALLQSSPDVEVVLPGDPKLHDWQRHADGILIRSDTRVDASDIAKTVKLKAIVKQGVGVDNIDLSAARKAGLAVHNTPALNSETVAELTLALVLTIARRIPEIDRRLRQGERVARADTLGVSLHKKTVGIIGMGNIGRIVARKFIGACDSSIIAYDPIASSDAWADIPHTRAPTLEPLLRVSDVVTLHVPLLDSTRNMIGEKELGGLGG